MAPLETHILSLTPSAPWLTSPLSHEQRQVGLCKNSFIFLVLKRSLSRILFSWRRQNVAPIRSASLQQSKAITEVNPNETEPLPAWWRQAESKNHAASKSDFPNMASSKTGLETNCIPYFNESQKGNKTLFDPRLTDKSIKNRRKLTNIVHFKACLQINVMTSSCCSVSSIHRID